MVDPLPARSALSASVAPSVAAAGEPGAVLRERTGLTLASVAALRGREAELENAVRATYGIELPNTPKRVGAGAVAFLWAGPAKWLAASSDETDFAALPAAVADQSDARIVLRLSGPRTRELLATEIAVDLHPRAFAPGDLALTHAASIALTLWQVDDAPTYDIAVSRSFAAALWRRLVAAGRARNIDARPEE